MHACLLLANGYGALCARSPGLDPVLGAVPQREDKGMLTPYQPDPCGAKRWWWRWCGRTWHLLAVMVCAAMQVVYWEAVTMRLACGAPEQAWERASPFYADMSDPAVLLALSQATYPVAADDDAIGEELLRMPAVIGSGNSQSTVSGVQGFRGGGGWA